MINNNRPICLTSWGEKTRADGFPVEEPGDRPAHYFVHDVCPSNICGNTKKCRIPAPCVRIGMLSEARMDHRGHRRLVTSTCVCVC